MALLYLVSQFARRLLNGMDRRIPKAIFLDEAWAITATPEGAKLVPEVSRMGRSRNTALILVSQNARDLLNEQVTNCISSVFAFRSSERSEVQSVISLLGVEASDEHKAVLRGLGNGEAIFRDLDGRAGRIGIDLASDELQRWLDTNPTRSRPDETSHLRGTPPAAGTESMDGADSAAMADSPDNGAMADSADGADSGEPDTPGPPPGRGHDGEAGSGPHDDGAHPARETAGEASK